MAIDYGDDRAPERFWSNVQPLASGCWQWMGSLSEDGYSRRSRYVYEIFISTIPVGFQVDHLCHDPAICKLSIDCPHRACVNPAHLRACSPRDNCLRSNGVAAMAAGKTHCPQGHPYDDQNTRAICAEGKRRCRICRAQQFARASAAYRAKATA